jgi:hypothetical protein
MRLEPESTVPMRLAAVRAAQGYASRSMHCQHELRRINRRSVAT